MFGVVATLLFVAGWTGLGLLVIQRWAKDFDPSLRLGLAGLVGLGMAGWITFPIGLLAGGLQWGVGIMVFLAVVGYRFLILELREVGRPKRPEGTALALVLVTGLLAGFSLVGVLAPSDKLDWDSLAYHLAVPKLWLAAGQIEFISFIHHSNFPFVVDNLYIWGLLWGGFLGDDQMAAKAFSWSYLILGLLTIFGLARARYGQEAGWWAMAVFAGMPVVIWLSGTGYIDVSNGLYAGLGIAFSALAISERWDSRYIALAAILLGFAAGSKYTGLQTIAACALAMAVFGLASKQVAIAAPRTALVGVLALAIASPWYLRNTVNTGNPVYPFFYSVFGGRNWDEFSARIYSEEQKTFGVGIQGGADLSQIGHAILGLAYQPGRYINPLPTQGGGVPIGALGAAVLLGGLLWAASGRSKRFEGAVLATVLISLGMWFLLSQQSRYIVALGVPLAVLSGGACASLGLGGALKLVAAAQLLWTATLLYVMRVEGQLPVALGRISRTEYQAQTLGFFEPAQVINLVAAKGKVALFDEVFGYLLDVPYFWANPGHTTELGYAEMKNGEDFANSLKRLGITHVYLNLGIYSPADPAFQRWSAALGLMGEVQPFSDQEREQMFTDLRNKWKVLFAEAVSTGRLVNIQSFRSSVLYELQ